MLPLQGEAAHAKQLMQSITGTIAVIQESRFRLDAEDGRSLHFTLSRHAPLEPQDLARFRGGRVSVVDAGRVGMSGHVALDVRRVQA